MGKLLGVLVLGAVVAGVGFAAHNQLSYDRLQPFPISWNHQPEELRLVELEQERRQVLAKIASTQRMARVGGLHMPLDTTAGQIDALKAELAALDERITSLESQIAASRDRK